MNKNVNIVWFKRDLRIFDHEPLFEAAQSGDVLPLYIFEPDLWQQEDSSARHWHFIYDSLISLQKEFSSRGVQFIFRVGAAVDVFAALKSELGNFSIWSHEESGNAWTYKRDIEVANWCKINRVCWYKKPTNGVVRRLKTRDNWAILRNERMYRAVINSPANMAGFSGVKSEQLIEKNNNIFKDKVGNNIIQAGGRAEALKTLDSFLKERAKNYLLAISKPGISARSCSRLSAHLAYGTISLKEVEQATKAKVISLSGNNDESAVYFKKSLAAFLSRLAWKCHFIQKLEQQPDIEFKCMHSAFEGMREPYFREDYFESWKSGNTGYPLIDACMRSLHENGWITFRMRAMLVSFASYHLWLDWRKTAPFLARLFTDYEAGIHYSQFQMQSGVTGINTVRIYNPVKQSYDQDPSGKFIRRYVPELKNVPDSFIHEPWLLENSSIKYPKPIINSEQAMKFAREEISKRWHANGFYDEASAINKKLGSRTKPAMSRSNKKPAKTHENSQIELNL